VTTLSTGDAVAARPGPAVVPASGDRRRHPAPAHLTFFHGPMDCGKSTLALQVDHNQSRQGRHGLLVTQGDRSAAPQISSRVGLSREAVEIDAGTDLRLLVRDRWADGHRVDYLIVDEAQFLTAGQVDSLAELVDESHVDVYAFGLTTDFRTRLFPGTQRLLEIADVVQRVQVEVLCWCGLPGLLNARVVDGAMVRSGETVVVADTAPSSLPPGEDPLPASAVRYQVLCRRHYVRGELGPTAAGPGQLALR
jgi:thymidine kinase